MRPIRGCIDCGRCSVAKASSNAVFNPKPETSWSEASSRSEAESFDMERK